MKSVLVAYATKYGSTQEVAESVGRTIAEKGFDVDVRPAREVRDISGYSAVVVGGALYYFMWHGDVKRFLSKHRKTLVDLPVALFAMGPFNCTEEELASARAPVDRYLSRNDWLSPKSVAIFGGRMDPTALRFPENNPAMKQMPPSDARDWEVIGAWASELPQAFGLT